jgi:serine/threonine-protein kinase HipA
MTSDHVGNESCYVFVVLPGRIDPTLAGRYVLDTDRAGETVGRFVYGNSYLNRDDALPFDPVELTLSKEAYETTCMGGVFGVLRDASPDFWGRRIIEKRLGMAALTEIDYLLHSPDDRAGALMFSSEKDYTGDGKPFNRVMDLERLQSVADEVISGEQPADASMRRAMMEDMLKLGSSVGGMRPKTVIWDDGALWIAKFNTKDDRWNNAKVEHATLELARSVGIRAAESRLVVAGGRDVLLVKRFDRYGDGQEEALMRRRMVSALTILKTSDSISDRQRWSYVALAEEMRRFCANPADDIRELFRRMVFNALISNADDHPRNHAFIADKDWRLSPAYDLTPMPQISLEHRDLAMICGEHGRAASRDNMLSASRRFMTGKDEAEEIIGQMSDRVGESWRRVFSECGVSEADMEALAPAFLYPGFLNWRLDKW